MTEPDKDNTAKILDEIKAVMNKYGVPKGLIFIPDRIEISTKRNANDSFYISYKEHFEYLPKEIANLAIVNATNFLIQIGIPKSQIKRIADNGVGWEHEGKTISPSMLILELLNQKRFSEEELERLLTSTKKNSKSQKESFDLVYEWNDEIATKFLNNSIQMRTIFERNPSLSSEMKAIMKKHTESFEKVRSILEKKEDDKTKPS